MQPRHGAGGLGCGRGDAAHVRNQGLARRLPLAAMRPLRKQPCSGDVHRRPRLSKHPKCGFMARRASPLDAVLTSRGRAPVGRFAARPAWLSTVVSASVGPHGRSPGSRREPPARAGRIRRPCSGVRRNGGIDRGRPGRRPELLSPDARGHRLGVLIDPHQPVRVPAGRHRRAVRHGAAGQGRGGRDGQARRGRAGLAPGRVRPRVLRAAA